MADNPSMKWYVVHTYSGYENKVKANLDKNVENNGLQDMIGAVEIPVEEVLEIRNGKSHVVQRKRMPGYVLVRMVMTNESWYIVRNTRGVTGLWAQATSLLPCPMRSITRSWPPFPSPAWTYRSATRYAF